MENAKYFSKLMRLKRSVEMLERSTIFLHNELSVNKQPWVRYSSRVYWPEIPGTQTERGHARREGTVKKKKNKNNMVHKNEEEITPDTSACFSVTHYDHVLV